MKELNDSENVIVDVTISFPWEDISLSLCNSITNGEANPGKIKIACSISNDLRDISIMHSIFRIPETGRVMDVELECMQILDFSAIRRAAAFWRQDIGLQLASFPTWLWTFFSPYGCYFLAFDEDGELLLFEEQSERPTRTISWNCIARTTSESIYNPIFHPTAQLICLIGNESTYVWPFESPTTRGLHKVAPYVLENPTFSECGQYLEGYRMAGIKPRAGAITLSLRSILKACQSKAISKDMNEATTVTVPMLDSSQGRLQRPCASDGGITLGRGHINRQKLKQYTHEAAIIWEHPTKQSSTVLRLPQSLAATSIDANATLSVEDENQMFVYLDKAQQASYDLRRPAEECFPMILTRQRDTLAVSSLRRLPGQPRPIQVDGSEPSIGKEDNVDSGLGMIAEWLNASNAFALGIRRDQFLTASAEIGPKTYAIRTLGFTEGVRGQGPFPTFGRRRAAPLLLEGPKDSIQVSHPLAPQIQAEPRLWREWFWIFNDFNWDILYGFVFGVFTSLITFSVIFYGSTSL